LLDTLLTARHICYNIFFLVFTLKGQKGLGFQVKNTSEELG
jgi:hypothetical protein